MRTCLLLALAVALAACGGGGGDFPPESGVDPSLTVSALATTDLDTLCEWSTDAEGGAGHVAHCGDFDVTTNTVAMCVANLEMWTCPTTVAEYEASVNATEGDGCRLLTEEACGFFFECSP